MFIWFLEGSRNGLLTVNIRLLCFTTPHHKIKGYELNEFFPVGTLMESKCETIISKVASYAAAFNITQNVIYLIHLLQKGIEYTECDIFQVSCI